MSCFSTRTTSFPSEAQPSEDHHIHLSDIEAKDELEREEVLVLLTECADQLKLLLHGLVPGEEEPVGEGDHGVDAAVDDQVPPDALEDAAAPDPQNVQEGAAPGGGLPTNHKTDSS